MTTTPKDADDIGFDQPELFPELMVYITVRVAADGRWSDHVRISTPNGRETLNSFGRSGGILLSGKRKIMSDMDGALDTAMEYLVPFSD